MFKKLTLILMLAFSINSHAQSYLALGDSIAFGATPNVPRFTDSHAYLAYPEFLSKILKLKLTNAACPGQSTDGFIRRDGNDLACFQNLNSGFKLKVDWNKPTQSQFAIEFLKKAKDIKLVTLQLGANDLIEKLARCKSVYEGCKVDTRYGEIPETLFQIKKNIEVILSSIRKVYSGPMVVVNYYSLDYNDGLTTITLEILNKILESQAKKKEINAKVADVFTAFQKMSKTTKGDICKLGLLTKNPDCEKMDPASEFYPTDYCASGLRVDPKITPCDSHPSLWGQKVIAETIFNVIK